MSFGAAPQVATALGIAWLSLGAPISSFAADGILGEQRAKEALVRHPEAAGIAIYATPPAGSALVLATATPGTRAPLPDSRETEVIRSSTTVEVKTDGGYEILMPLLNVNEETIGALAVMFSDKATAEVRQGTAKAIQHQLARRIGDSENVFEKYPFERFPENVYAQAILLNALARHPEVVVMAIHAIPPGGTGGRIISCNIGRVGMTSDEADLEVIKTGKPELKVRPASRRFKTQVPLYDSRGATVGALSVFYKYKEGDSEDGFRKRSEALRDELKPQIADKAALFASATLPE